MTLSLLLTAAFVGLAAAQTTETVQGTVKDQQGSATGAKKADEPQSAEPAQASPADTGASKSEEKKEESVRLSEEVEVVGLRESLEKSLEPLPRGCQHVLDVRGARVPQLPPEHTRALELGEALRERRRGDPAERLAELREPRATGV